MKNFIVYKSSAGSGKTHTLVKEYIKLVIENPERYKNILAITFTNKAANEMKGRVLDDLKKLTSLGVSERDGKLNDLVGSLTSSLKISEQLISKRAEIALGFILHNYSSFAVSTIDSFVHKLVRSFALDLRLPPNFEVELDTDKLISKSIDLLINKVGTNKELTNILVRFVEARMEDERSWNIELELKKFSKILLNEDSFEAIKKLKPIEVKDFIAINKKLHAWIGAFEKQLKEIASEAHKLIDENEITNSSFYQGKTGIGTYFRNLVEGKVEKITPNKHVLTTVEEDKWFSGRSTEADRFAINTIKDQLGEVYLDIHSFKEKYYSDYKLYKIILQNLFPIAVLNAIEEVMDEFRQNENIVHIAEFNKRIAQIIGAEHIPFIYERIGEKYWHFLVDEFQDTSILQWQNLIPLYENSLGSNRFNMIVGDGKQAIYRFRSGDVEQFKHLPAIDKAPNDPIAITRENLLKSQYTEKILNTNYRSNEHIVKFNNNFFGFVRQKLSERHLSIYDAVKQEYDPKNQGGSVQIEFMDHQDLKIEEFSMVECERIYQIITQDLSDTRLEEMAILTRSNNEGSKIAQFMLERGINVISAEALLLSSSDEIRFIMAFLNHLNVRNDKIPVSEIITYLFNTNQLNFSSIDMAFENCLELDNSSDNAKDKLSLEKLLQANKLNISFSELRTSTLYQTVEQLLHNFRIDRFGKNPYILFFLDVIQDYSSKYNDGLAEFLKYWEDTKHKHSIIVPEGVDAIQIMTIHKAKGLQFPVVIYPFAEDNVRPTKKNLWINLDSEVVPELKTALLNTNRNLKDTSFEELYDEEFQKSFLDMVNLLYVSLTRPEKHLYILTKDKTDKKKGGWKFTKEYPDIPDLFQAYLSDAGLWSDEERVYTFGETPTPGFRETESQEETEPSSDKEINDKRWQNKMVFSKHAPKVWDMDDPDRNRRWGNLVHAIMSKVEFEKDLEIVINEALRSGVIDKNEKNSLIEKIRKLIKLPEIHPLFKEGVGVINEKDILLADGRVVRPDRLVFTGNDLAIIDYKTGQKEEHHFKQLNNYANILKAMGYTKIKKYLIYIDEEMVVEA